MLPWLFYNYLSLENTTFDVLIYVEKWHERVNRVLGEFWRHRVRPLWTLREDEMFEPTPPPLKEENHAAGVQRSYTGVCVHVKVRRRNISNAMVLCK